MGKQYGRKEGRNKKEETRERKINYFPVVYNGSCSSSNMTGTKFSLPS
jgi:hypothetical protein